MYQEKEARQTERGGARRAPGAEAELAALERDGHLEKARGKSMMRKNPLANVL